MKRVYKLEGVDCADCSTKLERAVAKLDGVNKVGINFITQKCSVESDDEDVIDRVEKFIVEQEPDVEISVLK